MKKLLPLIFLLIGVGGGIGAGISLRPAAVSEIADEAAQTDVSEVDSEENHEVDHGTDAGDEGEELIESEFVKLHNQFVVPIVKAEKVVALMVLALSVEVPLGQALVVQKREPKLRDSFLRVLFDHANIGGFEGNFTDAEVLGRLRTSLSEAAQKDLGEEVALDVLIEEIARQDY
ncbi:MAG: flagellar basal body-associated protein FliL [Sulfitobacter sp.]